MSAKERPVISDPSSLSSEHATHGPVELDFIKQEYSALREEVLARLDELWKIEKYSFVGAAGVATWLIIHPVENRFAPWLPLVFLTIAALRFAAGMYHLGSRVGPYLAKQEKIFLGERGGWETWFGKQRANETIAYSVAWFIALVLAVVFAVQPPKLEGTKKSSRTEVKTENVP